MRSITEICHQASSELYNELAILADTWSVKRMRTAVSAAYSDFIPTTLPQYLAKYSSDIFNEMTTRPDANRFSIELAGQMRELVVNSARRSWGANDEAFAVTFLEKDESLSGSIFGAIGPAEPVLRPPSRPTNIHGLCVAEIGIDWQVDQRDDYKLYTFGLEGVSDLSALCVRVPMGLRLPFLAIDRIAKFCSALLSTFYTWIVETISNAIRKKSVQLSSRLYKRPRVLIKDVAPTLAFACLVKDQDFVLFDDQSLTGFIDVMEASDAPTGISALKLSGILLGEIVSKDQSAISHLGSEKDGGDKTIDLRDANAYKDDEALRHAINSAWGPQFTCIKIMDYKDSTFVLFCPLEHRVVVKGYINENIQDIKAEIESSFRHILAYVKLIEDLKLGSIFEQDPRTPPKAQSFWTKTGHIISGIVSDKTTRDEAIKMVGTFARKFFISGA